MLEVRPDIRLPERYIHIRFVRASGPGGQNVNKLATAAQLHFDLADCEILAPAVRQRLEKLAGRRLTADGRLVIEAQRFRTQEANRRDARERLVQLIRRALQAPKPRKATRPTKGSVERRLQSKQKRGGVKRLRGRAKLDD